MSSEKIAVASVKLRIGDKEIELSVADAKALRAALDSLLGQSPTSYPVYVYPPYWWNTQYTLNCGESTKQSGTMVLTNGTISIPDHAPQTTTAPIWCSSDGTVGLNATCVRG